MRIWPPRDKPHHAMRQGLRACQRATGLATDAMGNARCIDASIRGHDDAVNRLGHHECIIYELSNPYEPPRECSPLRLRQRRSFWAGPLLSLSAFSLVVAFSASAVTVISDQRWSQYVFVVCLLGLAIGCFRFVRGGVGHASPLGGAPYSMSPR